MNDENFEAEPEQEPAKEPEAPKEYKAAIERRRERVGGVLVSRPVARLETKTPPKVGLTIRIMTERGVVYEGEVETSVKSEDGETCDCTFKSGLNPA